MTKIEPIPAGQERCDPPPELAIELRTTPAAFMRQIFDDLGRPGWMTAGTLIAGREPWPDRITVRDHLAIIGNLVQHGPNPAYHVEFFKARVPLYYGALESAMRYAPSIAEAFALIAEYASERPGWLRFELRECGDWLELGLEPTIALGAARGPVIEVPLLAFANLVSRYLGRPAWETRVLFGYAPPDHAAQLREQLECEVTFAAPRNAIQVRREFAERPNIVFDRDLWLAARDKCAAERRARLAAEPLGDLTSAFDRLQAMRNRPPRLGEVAGQMGLSQRTVIRRLHDNGLTYASYREAREQPHLERLLGDPSLTLEEVAAQLGYADSSTFSRSFKRRFGQTPGQFRKALDAS